MPHTRSVSLTVKWDTADAAKVVNVVYSSVEVLN